MIQTIEFDVIDSTNSAAKRYLESGGTESMAFVSKTQTHGRGQGENTWDSTSPEGLYYSLLLQKKQGPLYPRCRGRHSVNGPYPACH